MQQPRRPACARPCARARREIARAATLGHIDLSPSMASSRWPTATLLAGAVHAVASSRGLRGGKSARGSTRAIAVPCELPMDPTLPSCPWAIAALTASPPHSLCCGGRHCRFCHSLRSSASFQQPRARRALLHGPPRWACRAPSGCRRPPGAPCCGAARPTACWLAARTLRGPSPPAEGVRRRRRRPLRRCPEPPRRAAARRYRWIY